MNCPNPCQKWFRISWNRHSPWLLWKFEDLIADTGEGYRAVVQCSMFVTLFEDGNYISCLPYWWHLTCVQWLLENGLENRGYETCGVFESALFSFSVWSALVINLLAKFSTQPCEILSCTDKLDWNQGAVSIRKTVLPGMAIPMLKIRRPNGRLIFNMGIAIPSKTVFLIETAPSYLIT